MIRFAVAGTTHLCSGCRSEPNKAVKHRCLGRVISVSFTIGLPVRISSLSGGGCGSPPRWSPYCRDWKQLNLPSIQTNRAAVHGGVLQHCLLMARLEWSLRWLAVYCYVNKIKWLTLTLDSQTGEAEGALVWQHWGESTHILNISKAFAKNHKGFAILILRHTAASRLRLHKVESLTSFFHYWHFIPSSLALLVQHLSLNWWEKKQTTSDNLPLMSKID